MYYLPSKTGPYIYIKKKKEEEKNNKQKEKTETRSEKKKYIYIYKTIVCYKPKLKLQKKKINSDGQKDGFQSSGPQQDCRS